MAAHRDEHRSGAECERRGPGDGQSRRRTDRHGFRVLAEPAHHFGAGAAFAASRVANRYFQQPDARELRDRYLPRLKSAIIDVYKIGPVTADDLVVLETHLRTYVSDESLRREIFEAATAAAAGHR